MLVIAWISDMGTNDPERAGLWMEFRNRFPLAQLLDFSSAVPPFNLRHAAYTMLSLSHHLPPNSFLLCGIKNTSTLLKTNPNVPEADNTRHLWLRWNGLHLLTPDNGLIGLIDPPFKEPACVIYYEQQEQNIFFLKNIYSRAVEKILQGKEEDVGTFTESYCKNRLLMPYVNGDVISARMFVSDAYGNLIFNIKKHEFSQWTQDRNFYIEWPLMGAKPIRKIHKDYEDVSPGKLFAIFNHLGFLEIGINGGNLFQTIFSGKLFTIHDFELKIHLE